MTNAIRNARSFLFVPASRPERYAKALASGADCVILDLEDAVGAEAKDSARGSLAQGLSTFEPSQLARSLVRINAAETLWHEDDLKQLATWAVRGLGGVVVPKADGPAVIHGAAKQLGPGIALVPLIESVRGLDAVDLIARAPQVVRIAFGHLDFQLDAGMRCMGDETPLAPVRSSLVFASRRADLAPPVDGVTVDTEDAAQLQVDVDRARQFGFAGKLCIHPRQVGAVNDAFTASPTEVEWSRRVLDAARQHRGAAFSLDGRMVDAPVIALAKRVLGQS